MTSTVFAISVAYVAMAVLLLTMGLTSRYSWKLKALAIVVTSTFFIEAFFATRGLLSWPAVGSLPPKFQLLWARIVEPDPKAGDTGAIYFWIEELDDNNVPSGLPRSYRLPYSQPLADRSLKAREQIMLGNAQEGSASDLGDKKDGPVEQATPGKKPNEKPEQTVGQRSDRIEPGSINFEMSEFLRKMQRVEFRPMGTPRLPPKSPYRD